VGVEGVISHCIYEHFLSVFAERKFILDYTLEFYVIRYPDDPTEFHKIINTINMLRNVNPNTDAGILFDETSCLTYTDRLSTYKIQLMCYNVEKCLLASVLNDHIHSTIASIPEYFEDLTRKVKVEVNHLTRGLDK
jgi:hypothetical protein